MRWATIRGMNAFRMEPTQPRKLPKDAYEPVPGRPYQPLIGDEVAHPRELTVPAVILGILLGALFGAANTYLGLKSGLTISTSIPVAVLTVVAFKALRRKPGLLEANLSQTIGSASSSVASGVLFTIPALFMWGIDTAWLQITLLAMSGGLLGVLAMVPLRRFLIEREHGKLPYPEGMACAEVLVAADSGGKQASGVFWGIGVGMLFKLLVSGAKLVKGSFAVALGGRAELAVGVSPALFGVGWILGIRVASVMVAGGLLASLVLIPAIAWWGDDLVAPFYPEQEKLIRDMSTGELWNRYIRYIGAGAVAFGGIVTLIKSLPVMVESFRTGLGNLAGTNADADSTGASPSGGDEVGGVCPPPMRKGAAPVMPGGRTGRDLPIVFVGSVFLAVLVVLAVAPGVLGALESSAARIIAAGLVGVFAFFFVTVSSRIVGLVGVTSNPTSGMTIATLLGTGVLFWAFGFTDTAGKATALMVGTAVCIAASIAGDTSQDLKTGFILGATPRRQQLGELLGVVTSAGVVAWVVLLLDSNVPGGLGGAELPAPQATLAKLVVDGVIDQNLPWTLVGIGAAIAAVVTCFNLPVLAFAVGVYLPLDTMSPVFLGGLLRWWLCRNKTEAVAEQRRERGVLFGAGLVGGAGLTGVLLALYISVSGGGRIAGFDTSGFGETATWILPLVAVVLLLAIFGRFASAGRPES